MHSNVKPLAKGAWEFLGSGEAWPFMKADGSYGMRQHRKTSPTKMRWCYALLQVEMENPAPLHTSLRPWEFQTCENAMSPGQSVILLVWDTVIEGSAEAELWRDRTFQEISSDGDVSTVDAPWRSRVTGTSWRTGPLWSCHGRKIFHTGSTKPGVTYGAYL